MEYNLQKLLSYRGGSSFFVYEALENSGLMVRPTEQIGHLM